MTMSKSLQDAFVGIDGEHLDDSRVYENLMQEVAGNLQENCNPHHADP